MSQHRVMIIYDTHQDTPKGRIGWAFWRRAEALKKYAPADFQVDIFRFKDVPWSNCGRYDLVFNLEYSNISRDRIKNHGPNTRVPIVASFNSDSQRRREFWPTVREQADFVIFNNLDAFTYYGRPERSCCISNGVDVDLFHPVVPIDERRHRCLFAGSSNPQKGKGWQEVFIPLMAMLGGYGFEADFKKVDTVTAGTVMTTSQMLDWYNSGSYVLCASRSEGTPNHITEGVACGCVAVSVGVGNICEWGVANENCVLTERSADAFMKALLYAKDHRQRLSEAGRCKIASEWSYGGPGNRAAYFFALFRRIISRGAHSVQPFSYSEKPWAEI